MTKYFEEEDIKNLLAFELEENNEYFLKVLNENADSFETEQEREAYISLVRDINETVTNEFREEFLQNIDYWLMKNNDLDELASLYQMTTDLAENGFKQNELTDTFIEEENLTDFDTLWEMANEDMKANGLEGHVGLVSDLWKMDEFDMKEWIKLNIYNRAEVFYDFEEKFKDWLSDQKINDLISNYSCDLDDYLEDKQSQGLTL
ncbi:hypothetical protein NQV05_02175 [Mycoplasmopsis agalactiae]|uniref:Mbov_0392 family ICE element protein n=1 Tax=Mycoplasmopsis agalactiae TaxID=2110 RepID=UPI00211C5134|nr:hypothetical protein [Mycoplasmopsis agalactiae]UUM25190.1 hypothetical protein NQV05_02175 [Mycoplasmopsis agalactiae]